MRVLAIAKKNRDLLVTSPFDTAVQLGDAATLVGPNAPSLKSWKEEVNSGSVFCVTAACRERLTIGGYLPIIRPMRRKQGTLLPIELSILESGLELHARQVPEFYGFLIAKQLTEREGARKLTAYGTLYKALSRMENQGLLTSRWEDPVNAAASGRPRRRLYQVTPSGQDALLAARSNVDRAVTVRRQELMTS